jgi:hypothetical protein
MTHIIITAAIVLTRGLRRALCRHEWLPRYEEDYCPKCDWHRWH